MKIFITGGVGFIGSNLTPQLLKRNHKLLLLSRKSVRASKNSRVKFVKGDLKDIGKWANGVKKFKPDVVIHLAWEGLESYDFTPKTCKKNLVNSLNLIYFAAEIGTKKFLSIGSSWEYGSARGKFSESSRLKAPSHVPDLVFTKRTIQALGEEVALNSKMQFLWPRLFFAYGPGQKSRALIPSLVKSFRSGTPPKIKNKTGGNDFVYIEDVADAIVKIIERCKKPSAIYNIGSGKITSVAEVANKVAGNFNRPSLLKKPKKPRGFYADISKIKREVGWRPKTTIAEGVKKTVEYLR